MNIQVSKPKVIAFELTRRCPLNCRHCRAAAVSDVSGGARGSAGSADLLTTGKCRRILESIAEFNRCIIILTGGEPMTRPDIFELVSFGTSLGLRMVMASCGYCLTGENANRLRAAGLACLSFSIDGADADMHDGFRQSPGSFACVMDAVENAKSAGLEFQVNTVVTRQNVSQLPAIAALAGRLGAICFNPFILVPVGRAGDIRDLILDADQYERLLAELAELKRKGGIEIRVTCGPQFARIGRQKRLDNSHAIKGCLAGGDFAFISASGDVQTCGFLDISAGNLIANNFDFADIWLNSPFLNQIRDRRQYKGACLGCAYLDCCGGCRARALTMLGDYMQHDPICTIAHAFQRRYPAAIDDKRKR